MNSSLKLRRSLYIVGIATLLFYQNCSQSPDSSSSSGLDSQGSYMSSLPFAYDAKIDTLSYMSCSEMGSFTTDSAPFNPRAYFTFRAGAYNDATGGLSETADFYNATQYYANTDRGNALATSSLNASTLFSLSVRQPNN